MTPWHAAAHVAYLRGGFVSQIPGSIPGLTLTLPERLERKCVCGHPESAHRSGGLCELCMPPGDAGAESCCQMFRPLAGPKHEFSPSASNPEVCWKCHGGKDGHWQSPKLGPATEADAEFARTVDDAQRIQRTVDAALVRAAGCHCLRPGGARIFGGGILPGPHEPWCPEALAAAIEAGP